MSEQISSKQTNGELANSDSHLLKVINRFGIQFESGNGCTLVDSNGKSYLDFLSGVACTPAGHGNPSISAGIADQAAKLMQVSNYFYNAPLLELAALLNRITGWGRCFFANSGAEANECAIKLARKWAGTGRYEIICANGSFHGRTMATLAATGQKSKWKGFEPLPEGFVHAEFNDLSSFEKLVGPKTAAVLVEPIQGENGVIPAAVEFLQGLRQLCTSKNLALIFDEVQTGVGRTGRWWGFQSYNVKPDMITSAKGLANGVPIGVCIADEPFASAFSPGDHMSTFGGNALAARAALETLKFLESHKVLEFVSDHGEYLSDMLREIPEVKSIRGMGLMMACDLSKPLALAVVKECLNRGLVVNATSESTLRFLPPLVVSQEELDRGVDILRGVIASLFETSSSGAPQ